MEKLDGSQTYNSSVCRCNVQISQVEVGSEERRETRGAADKDEAKLIIPIPQHNQTTSSCTVVQCSSPGWSKMVMCFEG